MQCLYTYTHKYDVKIHSVITLFYTNTKVIWENPGAQQHDKLPLVYNTEVNYIL